MKGIGEMCQPLMQVSHERGREKEEAWSALWFSERFDEVRRVSLCQRHTSESLVLPFPGTGLPVPLPHCPVQPQEVWSGHRCGDRCPSTTA